MSADSGCVLGRGGGGLKSHCASSSKNEWNQKIELEGVCVGGGGGGGRRVPTVY